LPPPARVRERVPVVPVPRPRVRPRPQASLGRRALPRGRAGARHARGLLSAAHALGLFPPVPGRPRLSRAEIALGARRHSARRAVARAPADPDRHLPERSHGERGVRADGRPRRRRPRVALSSRQDGRAHDRHETRHRRLDRRGVPQDDALQARVPGPVGDPDRAVTAGLRPRRQNERGAMVRPEQLYPSRNALAPHYRRFDVANRLLLTGHSHQAWPDRGFEGQQQAWLDAAEYVDDKWERAFEKADRVRLGYARLLDGDADDLALARLAGSIALGANTHELIVRFLSALPLRDRPRLVTTDGEFHTLRRQLDRLAEEGIEVVKVP